MMGLLNNMTNTDNDFLNTMSANVVLAYSVWFV